MQAEIMAACEGAKEAAWMEKIVRDLNEDDKPFVPILHCDNHGGVEIMKHTKFHKKAKHIEIKYMFILNDMVRKGRLEVSHIAGDDQVADCLTKQLTKEKSKRFYADMGLDV
jgi:hypothetical protein